MQWSETNKFLSSGVSRRFEPDINSGVDDGVDIVEYPDPSTRVIAWYCVASDGIRPYDTFGEKTVFYLSGPHETYEEAEAIARGLMLLRCDRNFGADYA